MEETILFYVNRQYTEAVSCRKTEGAMCGSSYWHNNKKNGF